MYIVDYDWESVKNECFDTLKDAKIAAQDWLKEDDHETCVVEITRYAYTENPNAPLGDQRHVGNKWTLERSMTEGKLSINYCSKAYLNRASKTWAQST